MADSDSGGQSRFTRICEQQEKSLCRGRLNSYEYALPEETTEAELLELVEKLNNDDKVNGILVPAPAAEADKREMR